MCAQVIKLCAQDSNSFPLAGQQHMIDRTQLTTANKLINCFQPWLQNSEMLHAQAQDNHHVYCQTIKC